MLGAIQIIRDTLRGDLRKCRQMSKIRSKIGQKSVTYYLNGFLTRFFHFPIKKTIPFSALGETYCIPILWLENPIYTDVSNGFFRQSVNWDNISSHVSSNEKKRLKTLSSLTFAAHKSIIHSHPSRVNFTKIFAGLFFPYKMRSFFGAHFMANGHRFGKWRSDFSS